MAGTTDILQKRYPGKSKRIKLSNANEKIITDHDHNYPYIPKNYNWINKQVLIADVIIEQPSLIDTFYTDNNNKTDGNLLSDHDYSFVNSNSTGSNAIMLRQDLFPDKLAQENCDMLTVALEDMSQTSRVKPVKTSSFKFILPKRNRFKPESITKSNRKLKHKILVHNEGMKSVDIAGSNDSIDSSCDSEVLDKSCSSKLPVLLKKVDPKEVPPEIKEARNLLKSNMIVTVAGKINQVISKHVSTTKEDVPLLKIVETEKVSTEIKDSLDANKSNESFLQGLKEHSRQSSHRHEPYPTDNVKNDVVLKQEEISGISTKLLSKTFSTEKIREQLGESDSEPPKLPVGNILKKYLSTPIKKSNSGTTIIKPNSEKTPILLKKVDTNKVPDQIKKSVPLLKINTTPKLHTTYSNDNIYNNLKETQKSDEAEIRLSSLTNASQVSTVGSTTKTSTLSWQGIMKPSTSNKFGMTDSKAVKVMKSESQSVNITEELSDDEDCDEELGLNSLEELQQFWDFLVELHDYNKQVIKSQQNRKRRYLTSIRKLEQHLKQDLGLKFEEVEEKEDEESSEIPTKKVEQGDEEENAVEEKKNAPLEE